MRTTTAGIIALMFFIGCATVRQDEPTSRMSVTVTMVAMNDLNQVIINGESLDNRKQYFVKSFYNEGPFNFEKDDKQSFYIRAKRLQGRQVVIEYRRNIAGDREIEEIHEQ